MTNPDPAEAARAVLAECARGYQEVLTDRLVAAYALGSLAHGGYAPAVSDLDLALVLADHRDDDPGTIAIMMDSLHERGPVHRKLSVFWGSLDALREGREDGRLPAIDRLDLYEHGRLLFGDDVAKRIAPPTADELLLDSARFATRLLADEQVVAEFHEPRRLLEDPVYFTKAVLFPVRFLYSANETNGRAAKNDEAIAWYASQPQAVAKSLVHLAAGVRRGDPLDPEQAAPLLAEGLIPLYRSYLDDQASRLREANAPAELITAFARWETLLTR